MAIIRLRDKAFILLPVYSTNCVYWIFKTVHKSNHELVNLSERISLGPPFQTSTRTSSLLICCVTHFISKLETARLDNAILLSRLLRVISIERSLYSPFDLFREHTCTCALHSTTTRTTTCVTGRRRTETIETCKQVYVRFR